MHELNGCQRDVLHVVVGFSGSKGLDIEGALEGYSGHELNFNHF